MVRLNGFIDDERVKGVINVKVGRVRSKWIRPMSKVSKLIRNSRPT